MRKIYNLLKLRHLVSCALVAVIGLSACSNVEEDNVPSDGKQIQFTTGVSLLKAAKSIEAQLPTGSQIGIFISEDAASPATSYEQNLLYIANGNGDLTGEPQYYPVNGNKIRVSAYYPYRNTASNEEVFTVAADQTTNEGIYASDLLHSDEIVTNSNPISLAFRHKLSQVSYELVAGSGNPNLTDAKVSIINANTGIKYNRISGDLEEISQKKEVALGAKGGIIVPQAISAGTQFMKITLKSGQELFYTPTDEITLESNKKYTFRLSVNLNEATSIETKVLDWVDGGIITGEAEEDNSKKLLPIEIIDDHFILSNNQKYLFTYDTQNRVSKLEHFYQVGNATAHIITTFTYSTSGDIVEYQDEYKYDGQPDKGWINYAECTYSEGKVTIKNTDSRNPSNPTYKDIYFDSGKNYLESPEHIREYDANGNSLYNDSYKYDNKNNAILYLNLPRWYITFVSGATYCTGKNNLIEKLSQTYDIEYNAQNYPKKISYTKIVNENPKTYYITFKYKNWNE